MWQKVDSWIVLTALEVGSAAAILLLGLSFFLGSL
jgi:hypothetical protein